LKPQLNAIVFANYAPVINNFGYDTAISNGQNVSAVVSFSQGYLAKAKKQSAAITLKGQSGSIKNHKK
jgi:hypothetical protein